MSKYRVYKTNVIEVLGYFSDREFQSIAWFENDKGLCYSFIDNANDLFDDCNLKEALYDNVIVFSKAADQALRDLSNAVDLVDEFQSDEQILNSPEMQVVREKAAIALQLVLASDGSESTVEIVE